ncbi:MAG: hypothetical protein GY847_10015 [Proteobacteria bacterium]|nr:hypothetical protein [Pseudomonadota bacterium]
MKEIKVHIYSDAGFSKQNQTAVSGFLLFKDDDAHTKADVSQPIQTRVFKEKNNIRAELRGVIFALNALIEKLEQTDAEGGTKIHRINLYTDCESIVRLLDRRQRLELSDFISKRTRKPVSNADLYKQFFTVYDKVTPNLFWVKGHAPKKDRDLIQKNFSRVDKAIRKILREYCPRTRRGSRVITNHNC